MARHISYEPSRSVMEFRLLPRLTTPESTVDNISLRTPLVWCGQANDHIAVNIPIIAAAMQAVSGHSMGIELARLGGIAFVFCSQTIDEQSEMIERIKNHKAGFVEPKTVSPDATIAELVHISEATGYSTFPVVDETRHFLGLITRNDYDRIRHAGLTVRDRMLARERLEIGVNVTSLKQANNLLMESHQPVLPILDGDGCLWFLVFRKDIHDHMSYPHATVDESKRLLAGAAINTHDYLERATALIDAKVDVLLIDSSDGHSYYQRETLQWLKKHHPHIPVVGGNVVTGEGFDFLVQAGADAVKVGMGGGSICITQEQKGTGRGLATAIADVAEARDAHYGKTGIYIPIIADGGLRNAKDVSISLALGADSAMMGRYFARMDESPTDTVTVNGRTMKPYWGEGSARAREWKNVRYHQAAFLEGVEGFVDYAGKLKDNLYKTLAKLRSTLSTCGARTVEEFQQTALLEAVSPLAVREGQVHDIYLPGDVDSSMTST